MRRLRRHLSVLSLLGMLLAQWSVAAYACALPHGALSSTTVAMADCEEHQAAVPSPLCARHCAGDQGGTTVNAAALVAPPVDDRVVLRVSMVQPVHMPADQPGAALPGRPPPLRILLQRFLT